MGTKKSPKENLSNQAKPPKTSRAGGLKRPPTAGTRHGNGDHYGPGWGGPAKGPGSEKEPKLDGPGPGRGHYSKEGEGRLERQARHAEEMRQLYYDFASAPDKPDVIRITAATHLLNRVEGLPVQKIVTAESDPISIMPDDQLDAAIDRQRKIVEAFERVKGG